MNPPQFATIDWAGRPVRIEHQWIAAPDGPQASAREGEPLLIFLHEGLGSLAMWKDFPQRLCAAAGCRGLVWSRPGYGRSTPRAADEHWAPDFMHRQALEVLPALLDALGLDAATDRPWLFGHSDGGSIALLHAAHHPARVAGVVALAPHIFVEEMSLTSIALARTAYQTTDLRTRLARYHDDPDSAFWGWNRIWLDPAFRPWDITAELATLCCPVLAVQGTDDEYGTIEQVHGIARCVPQTQVLELPHCGHSPQRDQPERLIAEVTEFIQRHTRGDNP